MALNIERQEIQDIIPKLDCISLMEVAFTKYSSGQAVIPPVAELLFENPPGDMHIKYGYIKNEPYYIVKIASGFYDNPKLGLPSSQGVNLLFSQESGQLTAILQDEGILTNIRTAAAGAVVAKYFAPKNIKAIGIIGTGIQGRLQLKYLQKNNPCKTVWIWDRDIEFAKKYKEELGADFDIYIAKNPSEIAKHCNLIVTITPSEKALLQSNDIQPGTHITAVGSDTSEKQELASEILRRADIVISDSIPQSKNRGEIYQAVKSETISDKKIIELGTAIMNVKLQRTDENQITVADLTGVAVQDIMISQAVYEKITKN